MKKWSEGLSQDHTLVEGQNQALEPSGALLTKGSNNICTTPSFFSSA